MLTDGQERKFRKQHTTWHTENKQQHHTWVDPACIVCRITAYKLFTFNKQM